MVCKFGDHSITCFRGSDPLKGLESVVIDKQGNEWYIEFDKNKFDKLDSMYPINAYNMRGKIEKKFVKSFLTFVKLIDK